MFAGARIRRDENAFQTRPRSSGRRLSHMVTLDPANSDEMSGANFFGVTDDEFELPELVSTTAEDRTDIFSTDVESEWHRTTDGVLKARERVYGSRASDQR